jgi:hypothetical protein
MTAREDIELYMRLSAGQLRGWTCISVNKNCAHCEGGNTELVGVTLGAGQFIIYLCPDCIVLTKVSRSMVLRDEVYRNIESHLVVADQLCEECRKRASIWRMFSLGPEGYKCHFTCGQCSYRWNAEGEAALPKIMATMNCSVAVQ